MKCLKSNKTGNIIRVEDSQAYQMAGREWQYVPKSEWKADRRPAKKVVEEVIVEVQEQTIAEKQLNKKKKDK
jgi:hypothetical protein